MSTCCPALGDSRTGWATIKVGCEWPRSLPSTPLGPCYVFSHPVFVTAPARAPHRYATPMPPYDKMSNDQLW